MQTLRAILLVSMTLAVIGCGSDDDDDDEKNPPVTGGEMMGTGTLVDLAATPLNGAPLDDGLDQVNADIMTLFGDANGTPLSIDDGDTVSSIIGKRQQAQ